LDSDDDPEAVAENWRRLLADFAPGADLADMRQVHGADVALLEESPPQGRPECDGIVTTRTDVVLAVRVADCVPVLLADPGAGVLGAAHAGRPGLGAGVVPTTVARMREAGADRIEAWVGPHVCGACYEVPEAMQAEVTAVEPASRATTSWGTPSLDLGAAVQAQLAREGVVVHDASRCTRESPDLYSYRRDGSRAGRLAGLIVRRS